MNQEIKAKWVAALRSGKYRQGYNNLNLFGKYCCLGVLCELAVDAGVTQKFEAEPERGIDCVRYGAVQATADASLLPIDVQSWAEIHGSDIKLAVDLQDPSQGVEFAANLNDAGLSFAEIADRLEALDDECTN